MKIEDLKKRKEELGYTNEMVSALSGVPLGTVQKIFGGATSKPRFNTLQSIECVLFPEIHSKKEAALYKDIVHNLTLDYADSVAETPAFNEFRYEWPEEDHRISYEEINSWKQPGEFTIEDWKNLPNGAWMELIDGVLYDRNYPSKKHQFVATKLAVKLDTAIEKEGGPCLVLAPAGVQPDESDEKNVFIPDIIIVCDREKYTRDEETIVGAPEYVAEILSPSTEKYDKKDKLGKYWQAGVREYWMVDIKNKEVWVYLLEKSAIINRYSFEDQIPLAISDGKIIIDFKSISDGLKRYFG